MIRSVAVSLAGLLVVSLGASPGSARPSREKTVVLSEDGGLGRIEFHGKKLGAVLRRDEGIVTLLDTKNPSAPSVLGSYDDDATRSLDGDLDFSNDGSYLFYARQTEQFSRDGLHVLDVTDPSAPALSIYFPMGGAYRVESFFDGTTEYVYVLDATHGLVTFRFEPTTGQVVPTNVDALPALKVGGPASAGIFIDVKDPMTGTPLMYVTTGETGLQVYDLSDPALPSIVGEWGDVGLAEVEVVATKSKRTVYAAAEYWFDKTLKPVVHILDATDLSSISDASSIDLQYAADPQDRTRVQGIAIRGNRMYIAWSTLGIAEIPLNDRYVTAKMTLPKGKPTAKAVALGSPYAYDVEVIGDRLYATDATTGQLTIFKL